MNPARRRLAASIVVSVVTAVCVQIRLWGNKPHVIDAEETFAEPTPSGPPFGSLPCLELGTHNSIINSVATDSEGRYLITGSDDGTARVWEAANGRLLQTVRLPGGSIDGAVYAVAITPDGKTVACGGRTWFGGDGTSVYFFDRASGQMLGRIGDLDHEIGALAFLLMVLA